MSKNYPQSRYQHIAMSVVAALWLSACGGGGGGPVADAPAPAPAPAPAAVRITGLTQQAESNTAYTVAATSAGTVVITLPPAPQVGDTVSVTGESANNWQLAQNAGQTVLTSGMSGNVEPGTGTSWIARLNPKIWHWLSSNSGGDVLLAGEAASFADPANPVPGYLNTSIDGGANWTTGDSPSGIWISSDMTPTADRMVAVQYGGGLYTSTDRGTTWTQINSPNPAVNLSGRVYESVNISHNGQRIVAVIQGDSASPTGGPIYVSSNADQNWTVATLAGGAPLLGWWRSVDSTADGMTLMAAEQNGSLYRSTDGGLTWAVHNVTVSGSPVSDNWYRLKMSANGSVIAAVGNTFGGATGGTGIYVSRNGTWTKAHDLVADYTAVAMSADGQVITVTASNHSSGSTGRVLRSTDGGVTFSELAMPVGDTNWRAVAMSYDGNKLAAATGRFGVTTGQLYTSLGNRTEVGTTGSITGGQGQTVELEYIDNGQFRVRSSSGGAFTIQ